MNDLKQRLHSAVDDVRSESDAYDKVLAGLARRRRRQRAWATGVGLATVVVMGTTGWAILGGEPVEGPAAPRRTEFGTPLPGRSVPAGTPVQPSPGTNSPKPVAWDNAIVAADDRTLTVSYEAGAAPCFVLDRVEKDYGEGFVTVTLYAGTDPTAGPVLSCLSIGILSHTLVELSEPLGGRELLDGARTPTPETVRVPDLVGTPLAFAIDEIEAVGLVAEVAAPDPVPPTSGPEQIVVVRQEPTPGTEVRRGGVVTLVAES